EASRAEKRGALGTRSHGADRPSWKREVHEPVERGAKFDNDLVRVDDEALRMIVDHSYNVRFSPDKISTAHPDNLPGLMRLFARNAELGRSLSGLNAANLNLVSWPNTPEMAAVLQRTCAAVKIPPEWVNFAGTTLDEA